MQTTSLIAFLDLSVFLAAAFCSALLVSVCKRISYHFNLLDFPSGRKAHKRPTPFLGGVAVFVSFWAVVLAGITFLAIFDRSLARSMAIPSLWPKIGGIFTGSLVILFAGLVDDKKGLTPLKKLFFQIAAAGILMSLGLRINLLADLGALGYVVTFVWILLLMNAFNFIDSLDGHCAGIAFISALTFFLITQIIQQPMVGLFLAAFAGAVIGFLPYNLKPAKIFLGDNGSLFIGYMMAAFTLLCKYQTPQFNIATFFIPVLVFGVPIYDTLSVIVVRLWRGTAPWKGDRNHFAHRLVKIGMSDGVAVTFSYFIATTIGLAALITTQVTLFGAVLVGFLFVSIIGVIAFLEYYAARTTRTIDYLGRRRGGEPATLSEEP